MLQEDVQAKRSAIRSVPCYLVRSGGPAAFQQQLLGSQPVNTLLAVFAKAAAQSRGHET